MLAASFGMRQRRLVMWTGSASLQDIIDELKTVARIEWTRGLWGFVNPERVAGIETW